MAKKKHVRLSTFLQKLYGDANLLRQFKENPKETASKAGLSPKNQELLASGDMRKLGHALVDEHVDAFHAGEGPEPVTFGLGWIVFKTSTGTSNS